MNEPETDRDLEALLNHLHRSRGFDFTGYKRSSLTRRVRHRMDALHLDSFIGYLDYLQVHPDEFIPLFNTILINVSSFFRDPQVWDHVGAEIVPDIIARTREDAAIRVWCAGCAAGQEAYTVAMILAEALGVERFVSQVKLYATDVDEEALAQARQATYSPKEVEGVPDAYLTTYFDRSNDSFSFRKELRRSVIFGRHDLVQDAPISRIDLLVCRNTLMYFNSETQSRILSRFHYALNDGGFLLLGKAEMPLQHVRSFEPYDAPRRLFTKTAKNELRERLLVMAQDGGQAPADRSDAAAEGHHAAFDAGPVAQVVVDADGDLVLANGRARQMFHLLPSRLGRPLQDVELSYRPVELRSLIQQVHDEDRAISVAGVPYPQPSGDTMFLNVEVVPLSTADGGPQGVSITFTDITTYKRLEEDLQHANHELETALEELQSTNEELETTNEELQSTNEELETTNEELQSTNEELETMNEELHSANEELEAANEEMRRRGEELDGMNVFMESILRSVRAGIVVLDQQLIVRSWSRSAEELWGLRQDEVVGRPFLDLDIGLPVERLEQPIAAALSDGGAPGAMTVDATNRRGKAFRCWVAFDRVQGSMDGGGHGVILLMEEERDSLVSP
jgi:two-component system CheB/CheR fusion protein